MEKKCISKLGCPLIVSDFHRETLRSLVGRKNEWNIFNFNTGQDNTAAGGRRKDEELTLNILIESDKVWIVECPKSIWEVKTAEWWPWKASNSMYIINRFIDLHDSTFFLHASQKWWLIYLLSKVTDNGSKFLFRLREETYLQFPWDHHNIPSESHTPLLYTCLYRRDKISGNISGRHNDHMFMVTEFVDLIALVDNWIPYLDYHRKYKQI